MRSGALDTVITIQRGAEGPPNEYGTPSVVWTDLATVRAQIIQSSTEEFLRSFGTSDQTAIIFRIRYIDGITNADRVVYDDLIHDVKELREIGRAKGLDIRTISTGQVPE